MRSACIVIWQITVYRSRHTVSEHCARNWVCVVNKNGFKVTTDSKHNLPVVPNILKREFSVSAPNKAWVSDITYIPTDEGWLYLAGIKEPFNDGELVGMPWVKEWRRNWLCKHYFVQLQVSSSLRSEVASKYLLCTWLPKSITTQFGMAASMSRKGDCYDNAPMKSFWGTLKNELVHHRKFKTDNKPFRRLPNISRSSITGRENKRD